MKQDLWLEYRSTKSSRIREELILSHLGLVKHIACRIEARYPSKFTQEDLESIGLLGLIDAIEKYDTEKGVEFEVYASARIRGSIIDEIRRHNWIPRSTWGKLKNYMTTKERLEKEFDGKVPESVLARELGVSVGDLRKMAGYLNQGNLVSLEGINVSKDGETINQSFFLEDHSSPDPLEIVEKSEGRALLVKAINKLEEKDKLLLALYYQEELTLKEIGKIMEISESRVCQLHARAIKRLRVFLEEITYGGVDKIVSGS